MRDAGGNREEVRLAALRERVAGLPRSPGVYLLKDDRGRVLYVGKANDLRARVRTYLRPGADGRVAAPFLAAKLHDVETIETRNEKEALLLENTQIKRHRPRYNVRLRDDKAYLCIRVDVRHDWPRLHMVRRIRRDGAVYFGPFSDAKAVRRTIRTLGTFHPLRLCTDHTLRTRTRPCLYYQLKRCCAPCVDLVTKDDYDTMVSGMLELLKGRAVGLLAELRARMDRASEEQRYEQAATLRDQVRALERTVQAQRVENADLKDRDVLGLARRGEVVAATVLHLREGRLLSKRDYTLRTILPDGAVLAQVLRDVYRPGRLVPSEILLPFHPEEEETWVARLAEIRGGAVRLKVPRRGALREHIDLAERNARTALDTAEGDARQRAALLEALARRLRLEETPHRIECYDISTIQGSETVGSRVVFQDGLPDRDGYRRFKVRTVRGQDDFASLKEILTRRFRSDETAPELIVVDGGSAQLSGVLEAVPEGIRVVGLAKSRRLREGGRSPERVYLPGQRLALPLPQDAPETYLLARVRDEAHRFAIQYHRKLRQKRTVRSELDAIPGLGPKRRTLLLRHFGSSRRVKRATREELRAAGLPVHVVDAVLAWAGRDGEEAE